MGCPFTLEHRIPVIRERVESFLKAYKAAGVDIDFIFADCHRRADRVERRQESSSAAAAGSICRTWMTSGRSKPHCGIRSRLQREAFGDNVTRFSPRRSSAIMPSTPRWASYWYD